MLDIPEEVLTGCGPEETFRSDYKAAAFPRTRPANAPVIEPTTSIFLREEIEDPKDCYYFESDHLALQGNQDYLNMLETVITLQAQRTQAIKDLETLLVAKQKALEMDALLYVDKLQRGEHPEYPGPQKIVEIPEIDWSKYHIFRPDLFMRPQTRHTNTEPIIKHAKIEEDTKTTAVKNKPHNVTKPETFGQKWTCEEQQKLEELLRKYPSEEIEMNRFRKIADALGNRTPSQVFSRCQKYFKKLQKKGMEIPGRIPKSRNETKKVKRHKHSSRPSTFFPYEQLMETRVDPVEELESVVVKTECFENNLETRQIQLLNKIVEGRDDQNSNSYHLGYKCYICKAEPIKGYRWHCEECEEEEINMCSKCVLDERKKEEPIHPPTHRFKDIEAPQLSIHSDVDYLLYNFSSNNYLDPNFLVP